MKNDRLEQLLRRYLTEEQISVIRDEITRAINRIASAVDRDRRLRETRDALQETVEKIDRTIRNDSRTPASVKTLYSLMRSRIIALLRTRFEDSGTDGSTDDNN